MRFYKLDKVPISLNWDEVAAGYNAYTIANWGADEYGNKLPITFKSFGDDKHPVHIYLTSVIVKIFGSNDFTTRAGSALVGSLSVLAIYYLVKKLTEDETAAIFASLFMAVSSYSIHFSRGLWEANFALFFFILGFALFYKNIPLSLVSFGLSFFSYHSAKIVVPPIVFLLFVLNFKKIIKDKKVLLVSLIVVMVFSILIIKDPRILGFARVGQTKFSTEQIQKYGGVAKLYFSNYKQYFSYNYLFVKGDQNPRGSVKVIGQFYKIDFILGIIGILGLISKKKLRALSLILVWLALAPIPAALSSTDTNATRTIFLIGPIIILSAFGASTIINGAKQKWLKALSVLVILIFLSLEVNNYLKYYFTEYNTKEAIEWQYGMKDIVGFVNDNPEYYRVYMDKIRQQPYIFFLYYLKVPLPELLSTVKYDEGESKSYNTVLSFDKYRFGNWNIIDSYPNEGILYVITPSYYGGLRYLQQFDVNKVIKYPDNSDAFYIVSGHNQ